MKIWSNLQIAKGNFPKRKEKKVSQKKRQNYSRKETLVK
jgi:hypothetical protein